MFEDKTFQCKDCAADFIFTVGEQEFYAEKGFQNEPARCKDCRTNRKNSLKQSREMFTATCADCGKDAVIPFKPKNDKPVYCSDCFETHR